MRKIANVLLMVIVAGAIGAGCGTTVRRAMILDSRADWVKIGPDVKGRVYVHNNQTDKWELTDKPVQLPEGWVAGPEPE